MAKQHEQAVATLNCKVSLGMFSSERGVQIELPDGRVITALVDKNDVTVDRDPPKGGTVAGKVKVTVVEAAGDSVVVDLPQPAISEGPRLIVPRALLG